MIGKYTEHLAPAFIFHSSQVQVPKVTLYMAPSLVKHYIYDKRFGRNPIDKVSFYKLISKTEVETSYLGDMEGCERQIFVFGRALAMYNLAERYDQVEMI